ncbi:Acyl carrier protein [Candidatus Tremblaya princeps]|uniref:Acyl carrier protein n=1 Tax=Tremblaya princeps TaxID=189385 RepID=A0A143WMG9_TREPR|nr:Acyl carrier protein [Candidatus Tremblaya princeps]
MDKLESRIMRIPDDRIGARGGIGYEDTGCAMALTRWTSWSPSFT